MSVLLEPVTPSEILNRPCCGPISRPELVVADRLQSGGNELPYKPRLDLLILKSTGLDFAILTCLKLTRFEIMLSPCGFSGAFAPQIIHSYLAVYFNNILLSVISGFRRDVNEIFALLGCYAV
jgi:hypothetical protein